MHPDAWTRAEQIRHEDFVLGELRAIKAELKALGSRVAWLMGGVAVLVMIANTFAPYLQKIFGGA